MRTFRKVVIWTILLGVVGVALLYLLANSSYVFGRVAAHFAPKFGIHYDTVRGNVLKGVTLEGLYYHDKKLARKVQVRLNPMSLLRKKITLSHLVLNEVDEKNLEAMIAEFASDEEDNSSSAFPFGLRINDISLSLLPFDIGKIHFRQATVKEDYVEYTSERFAFGTLRLLAKSSLGRADLKGHYEGNDLHLSDLYIGNLDTEEIEELLRAQNPTHTKKREPAVTGTTQGEASSVFLPRRLFLQRLRVSVLPRKFHDRSLSLLTVNGRNIVADLEKKTLEGEGNLSVISDAARAEAQFRSSKEAIDVPLLRLTDVNVTQMLSWGTESNRTAGASTHETNRTRRASPLHIPFVANRITIDALEVNALPFVYQGIDLNRTVLRAHAVTVDLGKKMAETGTVELEADSPLASLRLRGTITDNNLTSHTRIHPRKALIRRYQLPLRPGALQPITLEAVSDLNQTRAVFHFEAPQLLAAKKGDFNIDIHPSILRATYYYGLGLLTGALESNLTTPYTPHVILHARARLDDAFRFRGSLASATIASLDPKLAGLLKHTRITFAGDAKQVALNLSSAAIEGYTQNCNYKTCLLHLTTTDGLDMKRLLSLPKALEKAHAKLAAEIPIDVNHLLPLKAGVTFRSNVANIQGTVTYHDSVQADATVTLPPKTLLKQVDKNIRFSALSPMRVSVHYRGDRVDATLKTKSLNVKTDFNSTSGALGGTIRLPGALFTLSGNTNTTLHITQKATSIRSLFKAIRSLYQVDLPAGDGDIALDGTIHALRSASLSVHSRSLRIGQGKDATRLTNLSLTAHGDKQRVSIDRYGLEVMGLKLYATHPSKMVFKGKTITLSPLWVNDALKTTGTYDLSTRKGKLTSSASHLKLRHELADLAAAAHLKTRLNGDKISLTGTVQLQGGEVKYDIGQKRFAADSDIIILQRRVSKQNGFQKNTAMDIVLKSTKPLLYKKNGIHVAMIPDLTLRKHYGSPLKAHGEIRLLKGGYYTFENKRFVLEKSTIRFRSKLTAPILHIHLVYRHNGTTVHIKVSGTASDPILHFSSDPYMNREEILSFILFDTRSGSGEHQAGDVSNLVAGTLVKSLFASMGLKIDHLVLTGSGFEVGKKLTDKITVIYTHKKENSITFRLQNTKNIETDITFGHDSRSVDIFYKKEF